jgi:FAD:protein FMN transferase
VRATRQFRAMGCRASIVVDGDTVDCERLADLAMIGIARLEACWSPFLPDSDVSRLNLAGGAPIVVRPAAVTLLQAMAEATVMTGGAYDPTVPGQVGERSPWIDRVAIDGEAMVVQLGPGIQIDPAGIGKGLAADLVAAEAMAHGSAAVAIMIGGDGRVESVDGRQRWDIEVAEPGGAMSVDRIEVSNGAIATSGFSWTNLVDPSSGVRREAGDVVQISVLAGTGACAEALTKAVLLGGEPGIADRLDRQRVGVLAIHADGRLSANKTWLLHRGRSRDAVAA